MTPVLKLPALFISLIELAAKKTAAPENSISEAKCNHPEINITGEIIQGNNYIVLATPIKIKKKVKK